MALAAVFPAPIQDHRSTGDYVTASNIPGKEWLLFPIGTILPLRLQASPSVVWGTRGLGPVRWPPPLYPHQHKLRAFIGTGAAAPIRPALPVHTQAFHAGNPIIIIATNAGGAMRMELHPSSAACPLHGEPALHPGTPVDNPGLLRPQPQGSAGRVHGHIATPHTATFRPMRMAYHTRETRGFIKWCGSKTRWLNIPYSIFPGMFMKYGNLWHRYR